MKSKVILSVFLIAAFLAVLNSCSLILIGDIRGNGSIESQERSVSNFHSVVLDGVGDVNIHFAENYRVVVTTDSNIQDIVVVRANGNDLHIETRQHTIFNTSKLVIDVYLPELRSIKLRGVGSITMYGGAASDLEMVLSGVGNIKAQNYNVENVNVTLSGVGDIKTWATKTLSGKISGVGDVYYRGTPAISVHTNITGSVKSMSN